MSKAQLLVDGACPPSWARMSPVSEIGERVTKFSLANHSLMEGYVVRKHIKGDIIENGDDGSIKYEQGHTLYDVAVNVFDAERSASVLEIPNCRVHSFFGTETDKGYFTLRTPLNWDGVDLAKIIPESSHVLVLCKNGLTSEGIIVGFLPNDDEVENKDLGHNLYHSFNGIETRINKDGELEVKYTGQTVDDQNQVKPLDENIAGTFIKLTKEGNVVLSDAKGEVLTLDKANKKIIVEAREKEEKITEKDWKIEVKGNVQIHAAGNASIDSDKNVYIGGTSAKENLMLGKKTLSAIKKLVEIFTNSPLIGSLGSPNGPPVMLAAPLKIQLEMWKMQNCVPATSPLLAKKKFTE